VNKRELEERLIKEGIPKDYYWLNGGYPNESYCLYKNGGMWEVYYSERGRKSGLKLFISEEEACKYFYIELIQVLKSMGLL
jgi:hypothetical protein